MITTGEMKLITTGKSKMMQMSEMTTIALEVEGNMNKLNTQLMTCNRLQEDLLG
jgi:hypothetical protein